MKRKETKNDKKVFAKSKNPTNKTEYYFLIYN